MIHHIMKCILEDNIMTTCHEGVNGCCVRVHLELNKEEDLVVAFNPTSTVYPEENLKSIWYIFRKVL